MGTGESSADEEAPLAMSSIRPPDGNANGAAIWSGRGRGGGLDAIVEKSKEKPDRSKSVTSLGSEEDLLKRRMKGLTISLMGSEKP